MSLFVSFIQTLFVKLKFNLRYFAMGQANIRGITLNLFFLNVHNCIEYPIYCHIGHIFMIRVIRKPAFCICENRDADQLRGNHEADQRLCFRYIDSTIPLLPKYEISSL